MTLFSARSILFAALCLCLGPFLCAQTPAPNTTAWENDSLNLRLFYPSDLVRQNPAQAMQNGHVSLFGLSTSSDASLAATARCLRPVLLLESPRTGVNQTTSAQSAPDGSTKVTITPATTATLLLAELDPDCLSNDQQLHNTSLLPDLASGISKIPGMKPIAQPSTYTIGWQKVYMAAAQGQPTASQEAQQPPAPLQLFTMGISTNWNSHLLVWYFSSNSIDTLNRITKTTVRFGRSEAKPLYPVVVGTAAH
jgi:hypothetical protein